MQLESVLTMVTNVDKYVFCYYVMKMAVRLQGKPFSITVIQVYAQPVTLKKLKLNCFMKTYKIF